MMGLCTPCRAGAITSLYLKISEDFDYYQKIYDSGLWENISVKATCGKEMQVDILPIQDPINSPMPILEPESTKKRKPLPAEIII